jgi:hypothetical protein
MRELFRPSLLFPFQRERGGQSSEVRPANIAESSHHRSERTVAFLFEQKEST